MDSDVPSHCSAFAEFVDAGVRDLISTQKLRGCCAGADTQPADCVTP